jgi:hypothetical protein
LDRAEASKAVGNGAEGVIEEIADEISGDGNYVSKLLI